MQQMVGSLTRTSGVIETDLLGNLDRRDVSLGVEGVERVSAAQNNGPYTA